MNKPNVLIGDLFPDNKRDFDRVVEALKPTGQDKLVQIGDATTGLYWHIKDSFIKYLDLGLSVEKRDFYLLEMGKTYKPEIMLSYLGALKLVAIKNKHLIFNFNNGILLNTDKVDVKIIKNNEFLNVQKDAMAHISFSLPPKSTVKKLRETNLSTAYATVTAHDKTNNLVMSRAILLPREELFNALLKQGKKGNDFLSHPTIQYPSAMLGKIAVRRLLNLLLSSFGVTDKVEEYDTVTVDTPTTPTAPIAPILDERGDEVKRLLKEEGEKINKTLPMVVKKLAEIGFQSTALRDLEDKQIIELIKKGFEDDK